MWIHSIGFPSLECSKLYMTVEAKIIILSDVVLNICIETIWNDSFKNRGK